MRRFVIPLIIALPGWFLFLSYMFYEAQEYGNLGFWTHLFNFQLNISTFYHILIMMAPLASTFFGILYGERSWLLSEQEKFSSHYRDYYENAPYGYYSVDNNFKVVEANETWLRMFGYSKFDIEKGIAITDIVVGQNYELFMKAYPTFMESGKIDDLELIFICKDGTSLPVMLSATAVYDSDDKFIRSRTIIKDNTEKLSYESALKTVAHEWESTFNSMPWGVMLLDSKCNVLRFNNYFFRHGDVTPQYVAKEKCCHIINYIIQNGYDEQDMESRMLEFHAPESGKHFRIYGRPLSENGNNVSSFIFSLVDISDIKSGEKKILDSRNAFFNMLKDGSQAYNDLDSLHNNLIVVLANAIDAKSPWTKGHSERVSRYALALAQSVGLSQKDLSMLRIASLLHDIGKIGTVDYLLDKPDRLTPEEYDEVKKHPAKSAEILEPIEKLREIGDIVMYHHEQYDGTGYPDGLKGEVIPYMARILCVADSFDSMTADRPYRQAQSREYAMGELKKYAGKQFDPVLVEHFIGFLQKENV